MKHWITAILVGAVALMPLSALAAGIDNTHHDMNYMIGADEKCAYCHALQGIADMANYGTVGSFCMVVCHAKDTGIGLTRTDVRPVGPGWVALDQTYTATTRTDYDIGLVAFVSGSHSNTIATIESSGTNRDGSNLDTEGGVNATGWPYTAAGTVSIECTSCHAVHDNTNPPFLNADLTSESVSGGTAADSFCARCHTGANPGTGAGRFTDLGTAGAHPIEFQYSVTNAQGRDRTIHSPDWNMNITQYNTGAGTDKGGYYQTGGHLMGAANDQMGCYTCHSAHQTAGDNSQLLLGHPTAICYGCHGDGPDTADAPAGAGTSQENPGVTYYYHPLNTDARTTTFDVGVGSDTAAGLRCNSCHDMHGGIAGNWALGNECSDCHDNAEGTMDDSAPAHHPVNLSRTDWTASWTASYTDADPANGLSCDDCHVGFASTNSHGANAHNW